MRTEEGERMNFCVIVSSASYGRVYDVRTTSAMKAAKAYGRGEGGEIVTIMTKAGKILSRVIWSVCDRKYVRVCC